MEPVSCGVSPGSRHTDPLRNQNGHWYGVRHEYRRSNPTLTRTGNPYLCAALPIQSLMRRCIQNDAGQVVYYLHPNNSDLKEDGTAAVLDGSIGQVTVEIPEHYRYFYDDGEAIEGRFSMMAIKGFEHVEKQYVSAYEAALQRSTLKLSSVINLSTDYRGGGNQSAWDAEQRSMLGKPATALSRTNYRTYARNRGEGWIDHDFYAWDTYFWLFLCEYATRNCQAAVVTSLDRNGCKQGALGNGVTTVNSTDWSNYNGYYPIVPCGVTNSLGNSSGEVSYSIPGFPGASGTVKVNSYRGIEMPFGHIWKWIDGCNIYHQTDAEGGRSLLYRINNPKLYTDVINLNNILISNRLARAEGYIKYIIGGRDGILMSALNVGASTTTFWCDYNYLSVSGASGLRAPLVGGSATNGAGAGFGYVYSASAASTTDASFGSRLCFRAR